MIDYMIMISSEVKLLLMKQCCRCHIYDNYPVWKTVSRKSIADVVPGDEDHAGDGPQLHEHHPHGVAEGAETL